MQQSEWLFEVVVEIQKTKTRSAWRNRKVSQLLTFGATNVYGISV